MEEETGEATLAETVINQIVDELSMQQIVQAQITSLESQIDEHLLTHNPNEPADEDTERRVDRFELAGISTDPKLQQQLSLRQLGLYVPTETEKDGDPTCATKAAMVLNDEE